MLFGNFQQPVEMLIQRVFLVIIDHPFYQKGSPPADHSHDPRVAPQPLNRVSVYSTMDRDKIDPFFRLALNYFEKIFSLHIGQRLALLDRFNRSLVNRDRSHRNQAMHQDLAADETNISSRTQIHDRIGSCLDGDFQFF